MPGSGKSTIGGRVASSFGIPFFDLDVLIESHENASITEIFEKHGERYFRETERSLLQSAFTNNDNFLLSTGGGTPCFYDNMVRMKEVGTTVFINPLIENIIERLQNSNLSERPKLHNKDLEATLIETYNIRLQHYKKADYELFDKEASSAGLTSLLDSILRK